MALRLSEFKFQVPSYKFEIMIMSLSLNEFKMRSKSKSHRVFEGEKRPDCSSSRGQLNMYN